MEGDDIILRWGTIIVLVCLLVTIVGLDDKWRVRIAMDTWIYLRTMQLWQIPLMKAIIV